VDEVDPLTVDRGGELLEAVDVGLVDPPIVGVQPEADDVPEAPEGGALLLSDAGDLVGEAGAAEPLGQVFERVVGDVDAERFGLTHQGEG
jgi:hypothetical protein